jgi:hypothetical protein
MTCLTRSSRRCCAAGWVELGRGQLDTFENLS